MILNSLVKGLWRLYYIIIYSYVCTSAWPQGQLREELGKKHYWYSPIGRIMSSEGKVVLGFCGFE